MATLSQKIVFIERRIRQQDLAKLAGTSPRYIRFIKSGQKSGRLYEPLISEIYDSLKRRQSPPWIEYAENEALKLESELKAFKKELEIKPPPKRLSIVKKYSMNKRREYYVSTTMNFLIPLLKNEDYIFQSVLKQLTRYKIDTVFATLVLERKGVIEKVKVLMSNTLEEFIANWKDAIDDIKKKVQGSPEYGRKKAKKVALEPDNFLILNKIWIRIYLN